MLDAESGDGVTLKLPEVLFSRGDLSDDCDLVEYTLCVDDFGNFAWGETKYGFAIRFLPALVFPILPLPLPLSFPLPLPGPLPIMVRDTVEFSNCIFFNFFT